MKKNNIRGQIQLGETVAVIIIVIILLIIGIAFWGKQSGSKIQDIQTQNQELSVIEISNIVSELPELKCSKAGVEQFKCVNLYKLKAMSAATNTTGSTLVFDYYNNMFKNSKITIRILYPDSQKANITLYDAKLSNSTKQLLIPIPMNIEDDVTLQTFYGLMMVEEYYSNG